MIATFWISDPEIATFVNKTYGLQVFTGDFNLTDQGDGSYKWEWGASGQPKSELAFYDGPLSQGHNTTDWGRVFFFNATAVSYFDIDGRQYTDDATPLIANGYLRAPMAYAAAGVEAYAGSGERHTDGALDVTIHQFKDFQCTPWPSSP